MKTNQPFSWRKNTHKERAAMQNERRKRKRKARAANKEDKRRKALLALEDERAMTLAKNERLLHLARKYYAKWHALHLRERCPEDSYIKNGYPCNQTNTVIQGSSNRNSINSRSLSPRITARFLRINPQYWYGWPCLRVDFLGCSPDQVSQTAPTPLRSYNNLCLTTKGNSCSPDDNTRIVYTSAVTCTDSHLQFSMSADGELRHVCSGKLVCPENGATNNGAKLVVSSSCASEDSKFVRTSGRSLKHVKSGRCIHTNGGWPGIDREQVLWQGCDSTRLEIWFMNQDCVIPLGMENGEIQDSQITASSFRSTNELPQYARLNNNSHWCAKEKKKSEYLQVDLGEVRTVNKILIQGRHSWYDWVTGFHLYYSQDGQRWTGYTESGDKEHSNSICYQGKCSELHETQCKDLWGAHAKNGDQGCYDKLNTEAKGYGSCDPAKNVSCAARDVLCGQLQCEANSDTPVVKFGWRYEKITLDNGQKCSAATLKAPDSLGLGMVREGTKCGEGKICVNYKCQSLTELNVGTCQAPNKIECGGRGVCINKITCHCENDYNPDNGCDSVLASRDGMWGQWSSWSVCDKGCDGGKRNRVRFCDNPFPLHGGADCPGNKEETESCNTQSCPVVISCHHLQQVALKENHFYSDGVYKIYPTGSKPILAYCDMSRDGGGWTLLVTSHTNSWTPKNVNFRNADSPGLTDDYSILKHADSIKNHINVKGSVFEYRLEAQTPGRWGGIWQAQRSYTFLATDSKQTAITLIKKFDNWEYSDRGIEQRMPWRDGARLTTSTNARNQWWGTITGDDRHYHPAPWINDHLQERQPTHIWYWLREGPYQLPRSCMEVQFRGLLTKPVTDGEFTIQPSGMHAVKTFCDLTTYGGAWTLLTTSKTHSGWTQENVKQRNIESPSLNDDFSILGVADAIKDFDTSQDYFQYRIEADGKNRWGGIWEAPRDYIFLSSCDKQTNVKLIKSFDTWDNGTNLGKRMPRIGITANLLLSSASSIDDPSGSLVYNSATSTASYLKNEKPYPGVVRYWMREGVRLSCNDIKVHGERAGNVYGKDGFYMVKIRDEQYLPVYCDMTTAKGGFTLVITSAHNNWTRAQVPRRNEFHPALHKDYSILNLADNIKTRSNNGTFQYMLDAHNRRHWGGIFEAPTSYSFMATNNAQTDVLLTRKFNNWEYSWYKSLNKRMPWFDVSGKHNMALLTTSSSPDHYPSGSIIWGGTDRQPADWIWDGGMRDPGVIWYWVNEDDCDENRKAVNGGFTEWSQWERCDKLCNTGKQQRLKTCSNPKPRCGGKECDPKAVTKDERSCMYCPESRIQAYDGYCVAPNTGGCSPPDGAYLIYTKGKSSACNETDMIYVFDWDGVIHHKCSGKVICPQDNNPTYGKKLMLKDNCDIGISKHKRLLAHHELQNTKHKFCVHPYGGVVGQRVELVYWVGCNGERLKLHFVDLDPVGA